MPTPQAPEEGPRRLCTSPPDFFSFSANNELFQKVDRNSFLVLGRSLAAIRGDIRGGIYTHTEWWTVEGSSLTYLEEIYTRETLLY